MTNDNPSSKAFLEIFTRRLFSRTFSFTNSLCAQGKFLGAKTNRSVLRGNPWSQNEEINTIKNKLMWLRAAFYCYAKEAFPPAVAYSALAGEQPPMAPVSVTQMSALTSYTGASLAYTIPKQVPQ